MSPTLCAGYGNFHKCVRGGENFVYNGRSIDYTIPCAIIFVGKCLRSTVLEIHCALQLFAKLVIGDLTQLS